jgi:hypothetical protein
MFRCHLGSSSYPFADAPIPSIFIQESFSGLKSQAAKVYRILKRFDH